MTRYEDKHAAHARLCRRLDDLIRDNSAISSHAGAMSQAINSLREQIAAIAAEIQAAPLEVRELIEITGGDSCGQQFVVVNTIETPGRRLIVLLRPGGGESTSLNRDEPDAMTFIRHGKWSGKREVPAVGSEVFVTMNGFGAATVVAHQVVEGWLGLIVRFHQPPDWYLRQNGGANKPGLIFGAETR